MSQFSREYRAMKRVLVKLAVRPCSCTVLTGPERSVLRQLERDRKITYHESTGTWRIAEQVTLPLAAHEEEV